MAIIDILGLVVNLEEIEAEYKKYTRVVLAGVILDLEKIIAQANTDKKELKTLIEKWSLPKPTESLDVFDLLIKKMAGLLAKLNKEYPKHLRP